MKYNKLKTVLKEKNINQIELSKLLNISKSQVNNILSGRSGTKIETLERIARLLNVSVDQILDDSELEAHEPQVIYKPANNPMFELLQGKQNEIELLKKIINLKDEVIDNLKQQLTNNNQQKQN